MKLKYLPNLLTLSRVAIIPIVVGLVYFQEASLASVLALLLFLLASLTDFLDGYYARKINSFSNLGKFLDPIADKLLITSVLLMLVYQHRADFFPSLAIILRELIVSGLREFLADLKKNMPVSTIAKWKTAFQMIAISLLLLEGGMIKLEWLNSFANIVLWAAALLTLASGYIYLRAGLKYMSLSGEE